GHRGVGAARHARGADGPAGVGRRNTWGAGDSGSEGAAAAMGGRAMTRGRAQDSGRDYNSSNRVAACAEPVRVGPGTPAGVRRGVCPEEGKGRMDQDDRLVKIRYTKGETGWAEHLGGNRFRLDNI